MVQVWIIDNNNFYTGESYFVEEPSTNEVVTPITVGYVKPKWDGDGWTEGATEEEVQAWKDSQITEREPTEVEKQREIINTLGQELAQLKLQIMMGGI